MVEYSEIKTKKGKKVIFCNFEELLPQLFGVGSMEQVVPFANGNGEYICHCPFCKNEGHTKHKLYIKNDLTVGHCFVCGREYININDEVKVNFVTPDFSKYLVGDKFEVVKLPESSDNLDDFTLERFKYDFDDEDEFGLNYLLSRHKYLGDLSKVLGFKYWDGNIVMPFKYKNEVFYYQIRFSKKSKIRYYFPPISSKPPYIIDHIVDKPRIIICEGIFDAIALLMLAPDFIPVAVLGSSISDYQLQFIREYLPTEIAIYMDETDISKRISDKVKTVLNCPIRIIQSDGQDPEERLKELINKGKNNFSIIKPLPEENNLFGGGNIKFFKKFNI